MKDANNQPPSGLPPWAIEMRRKFDAQPDRLEKPPFQSYWQGFGDCLQAVENHLEAFKDGIEAVKDGTDENHPNVMPEKPAPARWVYHYAGSGWDVTRGTNRHQIDGVVDLHFPISDQDSYHKAKGVIAAHAWVREDEITITSLSLLHGPNNQQP